MKKAFFLLLTITSLSGCFHRQEPILCQTYSGMLPAASSVGIDTTISFLPNNRYFEKDVYVGEKDGTFTENGNYVIQNKKITLTSTQGEKSFYRLEKGQIRRLDTSGNLITGNLADFYILKCR